MRSSPPPHQPDASIGRAWARSVSLRDRLGVPHPSHQRPARGPPRRSGPSLRMIAARRRNGAGPATGRQSPDPPPDRQAIQFADRTWPRHLCDPCVQDSAGGDGLRRWPPTAAAPSFSRRPARTRSHASSSPIASRAHRGAASSAPGRQRPAPPAPGPHRSSGPPRRRRPGSAPAPTSCPTPPRAGNWRGVRPHPRSPRRLEFAREHRDGEQRGDEAECRAVRAQELRHLLEGPGGRRGQHRARRRDRPEGQLRTGQDPRRGLGPRSRAARRPGSDSSGPRLNARLGGRLAARRAHVEAQHAVGDPGEAQAGRLGHRGAGQRLAQAQPARPPSNSARWPSPLLPTTRSVNPLPVKSPANPVVGRRPPVAKVWVTGLADAGPVISVPCSSRR